MYASYTTGIVINVDLYGHVTVLVYSYAEEPHGSQNMNDCAKCEQPIIFLMIYGMVYSKAASRMSSKIFAAREIMFWLLRWTKSCGFMGTYANEIGVRKVWHIACNLELAFTRP